MRVDAFHNWRRELEAVEQEMNNLMAEGLPASTEERQVRRTRFAALVERREAAARNLLRSDLPIRRGKSQAGTPGPGDHVIVAAHAPAASEGQADAFVPLPEGARNAEAQLESPTDRPAVSTDIATPDLDAAAVPPDSVAAVVDPARPAELPTAPELAVVADPGSLPADVAAPAPDADALARDSAVPSLAADALADHAEPPADVIAVASDAAALGSGSDALPPTAGSEDAAAPATEIVAVAFDAASPASDAAVPPAAVSVDAAEPATDVVALAPDASIAATAKSPADKSPAELAAPSDHPVEDMGVTSPADVVAGPAEAASVVAGAEVQSPPSDDLQSEALLRKLLRRLQLGSGPKRT